MKAVIQRVSHASVVVDGKTTGSCNEGFLILTEGKYHEVKRMMAALGAPITYLERVAFAGIPLDRGLKRGEWRYLTEEEAAELYRLANA